MTKDKLDILMADDDHEDCFVVKEALEESGLPHQIRFVHDGEELLGLLTRIDSPEDIPPTRKPDLILLDLNMPRKDGRETLRWMKRDPELQRIPVVILTTSTAEDDIGFSYREGASSFITKPSSFQAWVELVRSLSGYWFDVVKLPSRE